MIEDDCGGLCFACRLTGLGFDEEQQVIVWQLMEQAQMAGVGWLLAQFSISIEDLFDDPIQWAPLARQAKQLSPHTANLAISNVMRDRTQPMSPEVAEAVRGSHR
jgi:hypothetical protein